MKICAHTSTEHVITDIYGDSGEKVNIFECDSIGHCDKNIRINMCLILNRYRERAVWIYT